MISIFRKIRQKLIASGSVTKYLLYAVGEILLVVVGILIALQVNNWNEERKLLNSETQLLQDIREDLLASRKDLTDGKSFNTLTNHHNRMIMEAIKTDQPFSDTLSSAFGTVMNWSSPFFTYTAYESLKSKGLDTIQDRLLKKKLIEVYEEKFQYLVNDYDRAEWLLHEYKHQLVVKYVYFEEEGEKGFVGEFSALKEDAEFINLLSDMIRIRSRGIERYDEAIVSVDELIAQIDKVIDR